jgi:hypothetical protein
LNKCVDQLRGLELEAYSGDYVLRLVEIYVEPVERRCAMLDDAPRCIRGTPKASVSRLIGNHL